MWQLSCLALHSSIALPRMMKPSPFDHFCTVAAFCCLCARRLLNVPLMTGAAAGACPPSLSPEFGACTYLDLTVRTS
eukprot:6349302-Amphidinium_carterae.1